MEHSRPDAFSRYQRWRTVAEPAFWVVFYCVQATFNAMTTWIDLQRNGSGHLYWEPFAWEWSSNLALLALVPAVAAWEGRFPLLRGLTLRKVRLHLVASVVFCLVHVLAMVALRKVVYATGGLRYDFGDWPRELAYEYLKDLRSFASILLLVAGYRFLLLRWQGEASLLAAPDAGEPVEPLDRPERFLVRTLGKEFLLPAADLEWLQAQGNYVNLHVRGRDYPLRSTMAGIEARLDPDRFVRVHRSYIVNVDKVLDIETFDTGDARARMRDGGEVPVSRRYREILRKACGA